MKSDWVVWLGCILLFGAGAIWAAIPLPTDFFKVSDVHDLFEIASSLATIIAVGVAAAGINAWRHQVKGDADNVLARRLTVVLAAYKQAAVESWADATFAIQEVCKLNPTELAPQLYGQFSARIRENIARREAVKKEFLIVLLEVKAVWGDEYSDPFDDLLNFVERSNSCARAYVDRIDRSDAGKLVTSLFNIASVLNCRQHFDENGWTGIDGKVGKRVDLLTADGEEKLREKLL